MDLEKLSLLPYLAGLFIIDTHLLSGSQWQVPMRSSVSRSFSCERGRVSHFAESTRRDDLAIIYPHGPGVNRIQDSKSSKSIT